MIRYAQYQKGDHVYAVTYRYSKDGSYPLSVHGKVISDSGDRELTIEPDANSNFSDEKEFIVYKDRMI